MPQFVVYIKYHNPLLHMTIEPVQVYLSPLKLIAHTGRGFLDVNTYGFTDGAFVTHTQCM